MDSTHDFTGGGCVNNAALEFARMVNFTDVNTSNYKSDFHLGALMPSGISVHPLVSGAALVDGVDRKSLIVHIWAFCR